MKMKTSLRHRLMRLGIICGALGAFFVAVCGISYIYSIEKSFSDELGTSVVNSACSSLQEEMSFLANGLRDSESADENDIFNNVFVIGEERGYDYSRFAKECQELPENGVLLTYVSSAQCYIFALKRSDDIIAGELRNNYFDYVTDTLDSGGTRGIMINNKNGSILISTQKSECGTFVTGNSVFSENAAASAAGVRHISGGVFSDYVVYSAPLPDNPEFAVMYCVESDNIYGKGKRAVFLMLCWTVVIILIAVFASTYAARRIAASITPTAECLEKFAAGEIDTSFRANNRGDETELLSRAMETTIKNIGTYIRDIDYILSGIANGNLSVRSSCEYYGDFNNIKASLDNISVSMRDTISAIRKAGVQVNNSASALAEGAQTLARNSNTEALTLKELDELMHSINTKVSANAGLMNEVKELSDRAVDNIESGSEEMAELSAAITDIRSASEEIQQIAKLIDGIAFQTNILALNAAVEASRTGSAGKGFAVVADEVRNLAGKSADAARSAVALIERSVQAAETGVRINTAVSGSLEDVRKAMTELGDLVSRAADSTVAQAQEIDTVNRGLSSITDAVRSNAAAAETSAAGSEELAGQAEILEQKLRDFKI
ncbi:MAG: hypothetical protein J6I96_03025 [Oscillospiraceae bacterium]|nr:hypothetical protein [Oscillospiraceae bacterium]